MLPRLLKGTHLSNTKVQTWKFQDLQIESDDELPLAADGEPLEPLRRFEVRVRVAAVSVVTTKAQRKQFPANAEEDQA